MKYSVILADPPWGYDNFREAINGAAASQYPTMTDKDIIGLDVGSIAEKDSLLFLWCTWPKLEIGMNALKSWGFKYVTCVHDWVKLNDPNGKAADNRYCGVGFWTRGGSEFVLMGRKGKGVKRRPRKEVTEYQVHQAPLPKGKHSAKPPELHRKITALLGADVIHGNAIELFARKAPPTGWDATGLDLDGKDIRDFLKENNGNETNDEHDAGPAGVGTGSPDRRGIGDRFRHE